MFGGSKEKDTPEAFVLFFRGPQKKKRKKQKTLINKIATNPNAEWMPNATVVCVCLPVYLFTCLLTLIVRSVHLPAYSSCIYLMHPRICAYLCLPIYVSICLSMYASVHASAYLSIYYYTCLLTYPSKPIQSNLIQSIYRLKHILIQYLI